MKRGLFVFLAATLLLFTTVTRGGNINQDSSHHLQKRNCLSASEECTKDAECCTFSCMCVGRPPCKCGNKKRRPDSSYYPNSKIPSFSRSRSRSPKRV